MITGVYEAVLYSNDIDAAVTFYRDVLGLRLAKPPTNYSAVFRMSPESMLIVFDASVSKLPGRGAPPHGTVGQGHVAFHITPGTYDDWQRRLSAAHLIELERDWEPGGRSIYVRDPAGNSIELVEGQAWPG